MSEWQLYAAIALVVLVIVAAAFALMRLGKRQELPVMGDEAQEPSLDDGVSAAQAVSEADLALAQEIQKAGEQAVAMSYGEPHQAEMQFDPNASSKAGQWDKVVKNSLEKRIGTTQANVKRRTTAQRSYTEQFLVVFVMAPRSQSFNGQVLVKALKKAGLLLNKEQVFEATEGNRAAFYVASLVKPGTFDLNDLAHYETHGINFILDLTQVDKPKKAFQKMLSVADQVAKVLGGDILDHHRQRMTHASLGEYLARVESMELRRKQMA